MSQKFVKHFTYMPHYGSRTSIQPFTLMRWPGFRSDFSETPSFLFWDHTQIVENTTYVLLGKTLV